MEETRMTSWRKMQSKWMCGLLLLIASFPNMNYACDIEASSSFLEVPLNGITSFGIKLSNASVLHAQINLIAQFSDVLKLNQSTIDLLQGNIYEVAVEGISPGYSDITAVSPDINISEFSVEVTVYKSWALNQFSLAIGWLYFLCWSISFYPQIHTNYKRKSVIGLNFDFVILNIVGYICYTVFNLSLYYIPSVKEEYYARYPKGLNPVQVNDIFFSVHAIGATVFTIAQCCVYERGSQKVSRAAEGILGIFNAFIFVVLALAVTNIVHWLDFLYFCSYIKLTVTLIKYIPQAYMNYERKSTSGWSINGILLDFAGGILSMLQMILNAHNYVFGDFTKFGLGLFSVMFDILFMVQHFILYNSPECEEDPKKASTQDITYITDVEKVKLDNL